MQYDFLQLVISSPLIHALGDPSQAPTGIRTRVPILSNLGTGRRLTNWTIPPPLYSNIFMLFHMYLFLEVINILIEIGVFKQSELQLFTKYLKPYLRTEATILDLKPNRKWNHIMILLTNLSCSHFEKAVKLFFKIRSPMWVIIQNTKYANIHVWKKKSLNNFHYTRWFKYSIKFHIWKYSI